MNICIHSINKTKTVQINLNTVCLFSHTELKSAASNPWMAEIDIIPWIFKNKDNL